MAFRLPLPASAPEPRRAADPPLYPPPAVWICWECGDVYDAPTPDGNCPNPGHAEVKLTFASIRQVRGLPADSAAGGR